MMVSLWATPTWWFFKQFTAALGLPHLQMTVYINFHSYIIYIHPVGSVGLFGFTFKQNTCNLGSCFKFNPNLSSFKVNSCSETSLLEKRQRDGSRCIPGKPDSVEIASVRGNNSWFLWSCIIGKKHGWIYHNHPSSWFSGKLPCRWKASNIPISLMYGINLPTCGLKYDRCRHIYIYTTSLSEKIWVKIFLNFGVNMFQTFELPPPRDHTWRLWDSRLFHLAPSLHHSIHPSGILRQQGAIALLETPAFPKGGGWVYPRKEGTVQFKNPKRKLCSTMIWT